MEGDILHPARNIAIQFDTQCPSRSLCHAVCLTWYKQVRLLPGVAAPGLVHDLVAEHVRVVRKPLSNVGPEQNKLNS
jgi:hypothetical protein